MMAENSHLISKMPEREMGLPNTYRANWLRFGAFLSPLAPSLWIHWPLFFRPRRNPPHQQGQVVRRRFPASYCLTPTAEFIGKVRTESNLDERSLYFIMSPNRAIPAVKSQGGR